MADKLLGQVTPLEAQIEIMNGTIVNQSTELRAKELSLEHTTTAKDNLLRQNTRLTKKLETTLLSFSRSTPLFMFLFTRPQVHDSANDRF
jgi:hypothetical protein